MIKYVVKEDIDKLTFPEGDVLKNNSKKQLRIYNLRAATQLGNCEKMKVKIYFKPGDETYMTNTTVWAMTDEHVVLKNSRTIPIERIYDVQFW
ncbi:MAG: hypothetical protein MRY83_20590 [Flavobacteriales bacterium]|nr:hypothetical protein [Flavobacteriales bacterium]